MKREDVDGHSAYFKNLGDSDVMDKSGLEKMVKEGFHPPPRPFPLTGGEEGSNGARLAVGQEGAGPMTLFA